jgi:hypothetical protein
LRHAGSAPRTLFWRSGVAAPERIDRYLFPTFFSWKGCPLQRENLTLSAKSLERTAYHEAGHAVLAHFLGVGLTQRRRNSGAKNDYK